MMTTLNCEFTTLVLSKGKGILVSFASDDPVPMGTHKIDLREIMRRSGMKTIETIDVFIPGNVDGVSTVFKDTGTGIVRYVVKGHHTICPFHSAGLVSISGYSFRFLNFVVYDHDVNTYVSPFAAN